MHAPTPPTPIPVMITGPDDITRRDSNNSQADQRLATFYTQDEVNLLKKKKRTIIKLSSLIIDNS